MRLRSLKQDQVVLAALILLTVAGMLLIVYGTRWGPWAFSDAVGYMVNARNLATGKGLGLYRPSGQFVPLVSHPPLYPLVLIALGGPQLDLVGAARLFDVLSFGILIFGSGWLFYRLTGSAWGATGLSGVFLVQPALVNAYTSAMSEPLFLLTEVIGSLLLLRYLEDQRPSQLVSSALVVGMAFMTRYTGAAILGTGILCLLLFDRGQLKVRLAHSAVFTLIASLPVAAFVLWSRIRYSGATPRGLKSEFDFVPQFITFVKQIPTIVYSWKPVTADMLSFPGVDPDVMRAAAKPVIAILALALAAVIAVTLRRIRPMLATGALKSATLRVLVYFVILFAAYLAFFGLAYVVTSPTPDVDGRTILPILPPLIIMAVTITYVLVRCWPGRFWVGLAAALLFVGSIAGYASITYKPLERMHQDGSGYTSPGWRKSETLKAARLLPPDIPLISNEPIAVLFYADRWPHELNEVHASEPLSMKTRYGDGSDPTEILFREQHGALILFDTITSQLRGLYHEQTESRVAALTAGLTQVFQGSDGAIYSYPEPGP